MQLVIPTERDISLKDSNLHIQSMARLGQIWYLADLFDYRDTEKYGWISEAYMMQIGDCAIFNDRRRASNFYGSTRRAKIRVIKYHDLDLNLIAFTRYS